MIGFDFDELEGEQLTTRVSEREAQHAASLGDRYQALSVAASMPSWCGSGLVVDKGGEAVVLQTDAHSADLTSVWGGCDPHEYPATACGTFWPLRDALTLGLDVNFAHVAGEIRLSGTEKRPLFFRPPCLPRAGQPSQELRKDVLSKPLFLHFGWRCLRPGWTDFTERWRVLDEQGRWLLEAYELEGGHWIAVTDLAEETDLRISSRRGVVPDACLLHDPGPPKSLRMELGRLLECHVITLPRMREAAVNRLIHRLHLASPQIRAYRFPAWDTRPLRGMGAEADLVQRGIVQEDKQSECAPILGCALSHSELWLQFLRSRDPGPWGVFEDDAVLNDVRPVGTLISAAVDALSAGSCDIALMGCVGLSGTESLTKIEPLSEASPGLWGPVPWFIGTWGYLISRLGAQRALAELWGTPGGLCYDVDICLSNAGAEGRLTISLAMPNVVLHPGIGGTVGRNLISYAGYEYYLHGSCETAGTTRYDGDARARPATNERLVARIEQHVQQYREVAIRDSSDMEAGPRLIWRPAAWASTEVA